MFGTAIESFQGLFRRGTEIIVVRIALSKVFKRISINTFALDFPNENSSAISFSFFINWDSAVQVDHLLPQNLMSSEDLPLRIIVMGVSGSGKSTLAHNLSAALNLRMKDGDELHLPESVAKMSAGIALQDEDRWPWLDRIASYLTGDGERTETGGIVACSALKRIYRDRIRQHAGPVVFLFLDGQPELIRQRIQQRVGHYMQAGLLDSQLQTLQKPSADEKDVITLNIDQPVPQLLEQALHALRVSTLNVLT